MEGKYVVVRSNRSGVWLGKLAKQEPGVAEGITVTLTDARKAHYWVGAAATSGLALRGPKAGSRICEPVEAVVADCCEIIVASDVAVAAWKEIPSWVA